MSVAQTTVLALAAAVMAVAFGFHGLRSVWLLGWRFWLGAVAAIATIGTGALVRAEIGRLVDTAR